jgi:hypothetical protein
LPAMSLFRFQVAQIDLDGRYSRSPSSNDCYYLRHSSLSLR